MAESTNPSSDQFGRHPSPFERPRTLENIENNIARNVNEEETLLDLSSLNFDSATINENLIALQNPGSQSRHYPMPENIKEINLEYNSLDFIPLNISLFQNIRILNISSNRLSMIGDCILELKHLSSLSARNNNLGDYSLPKKFYTLPLEVLNLSGNAFRTIPISILQLRYLRALYMGGNQIVDIPNNINLLESLEILYLGGNQLREIPAEMGQLHNLQALVLCENQLQSLPSSISCLRRLQSLSLHKNQLTTLPPEIVTLRGLVELSLRDNPLVVRFVLDMMYNPPSLQELAARSIKTFKLHYSVQDLPESLISYLSSAQRCVNPKCKGVYFDARVEHIKFVDFCGKYRLPLLQYLCSPNCTSQPSSCCNTTTSESESSDEDNEIPVRKLQRVLLG